MNFESALNYIDDALAEKAQRRLLPPEVTILKGTWQGMTYEQMANSSSYSANYLMRDIGPKFWKLLSAILGENVGKNNLRIVLESLYAASSKSTSELSASDNLQQVKLTQNDGLDVPELTLEIYGRDRQLSMLQQWTTVDKCRLIGLSGLTGVGKTVLTKKLVRQIQSEFELVIWHSFLEAPTLEELVRKLLPANYASRQERGNLLSQLIEMMRSHSCLIVLDGLETILQPGEFSGKYRSDYEDYGEMLRLVGESFHQSCMVLTSLEIPGEVFQLEQHNSPIRSFKLSGLSESDAKSLLEAEGLEPSSSSQKLIEYYQGNPAILNIVSKIIRELFSGNVEEFLAQKSLVFGEIERLLERSLNRLSILEREILYWLVSEAKPVTLSDIQDTIPLSIYPEELIEALQSINERALIEIGMREKHSVFIVPPVIRELVTNQFIAQIGRDFSLKNRQKLIFSREKPIELNPSSRKPTHLSQWLENHYESDWQPIELIFAASGKSPSRLRSAFNLREEKLVKRFKQIELATNRSITQILLLVAIAPEEEAFKICVQAQPIPERQILPKNLRLSLKDASNKVLAEIVSEATDNFIQLPYFKGIKTEKFGIGLTLDSANQVEEFVI